MKQIYGLGGKSSYLSSDITVVAQTEQRKSFPAEGVVASRERSRMHAIQQRELQKNLGTGATRWISINLASDAGLKKLTFPRQLLLDRVRNRLH